MASGSKRGGGGDMVLGGRHLIGIFILLVVVFGVVFTLGYLLGRNQYDMQLHASASTVAPQPEKSAKAEKPDTEPLSPVTGDNTPSPDVSQAPPPTDFNFYHSGEAPKPAALSAPPPKPVEELPPSSPAAKTTVALAKPVPVPFVPAAGAEPPAGPLPKSLDPPAIPRGSTVLQVAALGREVDATTMAQALRQKKFPVFVLPPTTDHFYRVQVGPYADAQSAKTARQKLESQGFKTIIKR